MPTNRWPVGPKHAHALPRHVALSSSTDARTLVGRPTTGRLLRTLRAEGPAVPPAQGAFPWVTFARRILRPNGPTVRLTRSNPKRIVHRFRFHADERLARWAETCRCPLSVTTRAPHLQSLLGEGRDFHCSPRPSRTQGVPPEDESVPKTSCDTALVPTERCAVKHPGADICQQASRHIPNSLRVLLRSRIARARRW
jgi:hypothetical protein